MTVTGVDYALQLDSYGFNVVPAPLHANQPSIKWKAYQTQRTTGKLRAWFDGPQRNYFIVTGTLSNLMVLDCDSEDSENWWRQQVGDEIFDTTTCVRSSRGHHFYFSLPPGDERWQPRSEHEGIHQYDLRAEGTGVIAPPSVHKSGRVYEWVRGPDAIQPAPEYLLQVSRLTRAGVEGTGGKTGKEHRPPTRSMLSSLLSDPGRNGRNNWVTAVLGHYALLHRRMEDLYEVEAERIWQVAEHLPGENNEPYTRREFEKTLKSVWEAEMRKGVPEANKIDAECGYLGTTDGWRIHVQVRFKNSDNEWQVGMEPWADFDIKALGVVEDDEAQRVYDVEIHRARRKDVRRALLPALVLNDTRRLVVWLGEYGVGILAPDTVWPKTGDKADRLRSYIESQNPPHFEVVDSLGWYDGSRGFVCHEGVIREDGLHGFEMHKPHPRLSGGWAPYHYGFAETQPKAQAILREVLTFHDQTVCAVFGSWWAACLLKPQIQAATSQFPFMALEAPSESGKTTGFFSMLLALGGNKLGNTNPTMAALRDYLSGNQSGIFWVDDLNAVDHLMELLRQATSDGAVSKKGEDRTSQVPVRLVNPICLSGESLPIRGQKALVDRAVLLDVPSPTQRRSLKEGAAPDLLQWADIVAMRTSYPDLTIFAGWYVAAALAVRDLVDEIPHLVPPGGAGRWGDKMAVLRLGARLLAEITGQPHWPEQVDTWVEGQFDLGSENTLTLRTLPEALSTTGWQSKPAPPERGWPATPVFVDSSQIVWFQPDYLGQWWLKHKNGKIEQRTETVDALTQQAKALGLGGTKGVWRKQVRIGHTSGETGNRAYYWRLSDTLSSIVLGRSRGDSSQGPSAVSPDGETDGGDTPSQGTLGVHEHTERRRNLDFPMGRSIEDLDL